MLNEKPWFESFCFAVLWCFLLWHSSLLSLVYPLGNACLCHTSVWVVDRFGNQLTFRVETRQKWDQYPGEFQAGTKPAQHKPILAVLLRLLMIIILCKNIWSADPKLLPSLSVDSLTVMAPVWNHSVDL